MKKTSSIERILSSFLVVLLPAQIGKHFWPQEAFVRGIRIDYLSPTLFVTDLLLISLLITWALKKLTKLQISTLKKGNWLALALSIGLLIAINILTASSKLVASYQWLRLIELALLFFYVKSAPKDIIDRLTSLLPLPIIYSSLIALAQFLKQASIGGALYWLGERRFTIVTPGIAKTEIFGRLVLRPYATFPHPNTLAGFILISLVLLLPLLLTKAKKDNHLKKLLPIAFFLGAVTLLLTFSLSAWMAAALLLIIATLEKLRRKMLLALALLILLLTVLVSAFPPEEQSINQRLTTAKTALVMVKDRPFIGVGLGNFIPNLAELDQDVRLFHSPFLFYQPVHNIYLLTAAETGTIGLLAFLCLIIRALKKAKQKRRFEVTLALIGILLIGLVDHYWLTLHQTRLLFTIVLALTLR